MNSLKHKRFVYLALFSASVIIYMAIAYFPRMIQAQDIAVEFKLLTPVVQQNNHKPALVRVELAIQNNSSQPIEIDLGSMRMGNIEFAVKSPNSDEFEVYKFGGLGLSLEDTCRLKPGERCQQELTLNKLKRQLFYTPGLYEIRPNITAPIIAGEVQLQSVASSVMQLQIQPHPTTVKVDDIVFDFNVPE